jgi:5-methylcytosine-specific restriction endonuclease McrA
MAKKRNQRCVYCGSEGPLSIDHVVPIAHWQEYHVKRRILDNDSNRVTACVKCNHEKGGMSPKEWFERHPAYKARFLHQAKYVSDTVKRIAGLLE